MDVNTLRIAVTVAGLLLFVALVLHTWSRQRRADHDAAAMLPFVDDAADAYSNAPSASNAAARNPNQGVKP
jgi:cbb3-type cytochrome oxidase subunit 3